MSRLCGERARVVVLGQVEVSLKTYRPATLLGERLLIPLGPYPEYTPRPVLPFFSGLSLSCPQPAFQHPAPFSLGMTKTPSTGGPNDTPATTGRLDPKRAATLPAGVEALCAEKRHYDPSREPKLLHFM
jgi:hypothetical protein